MSVPVPPGPYAAPTPRASDPTVLATGQVVPRQTMPVVEVGDSFSVDLASAPQVLGELRAAVEELTAIRRDSVQLGKIDPGTQDQVSRDAATVFEAIATGGAGSLLEAVDGGIRRLEALADAVEVELREYRSAEDVGRRGFDALP